MWREEIKLSEISPLKLRNLFADEILKRKKNTMDENLRMTLSLAEALMVPATLDALTLNIPASSLVTFLIVRK